MADEPRPRVAVVGGFYDLDADPQLGQEARDYAQALGRTLAEPVLGSSSTSRTTSRWSPTSCVGSWLRYLLASLHPASTCATRKHSAGR